MKNLSKIVVMFLAVLSCINFAACSDEDKNEEIPETPALVNPSNVFINGSPKEAEGLTFIYNAEGLLTSISEKGGGDRVSLDYSTLGQSKVQMVIYGTYGTYILDMTIGDNGFVTSCVESGPDGNDTWSFGYTASGQLNYMKRSEGGDEITNITYDAEGDITRVTMQSDDERMDCDISYTTKEINTPIENKGYLMLFDTTFDIDLDEMRYAYYAGLLGKATKHLPLSSSRDGDVDFFDWSFNANGFPTSLSAGYETIEFAW